MSRDGVRGVVLCEDRRTERFFRRLLTALGFNLRKFTFLTAPSGVGAGEAWVLQQMPREVGVVRRYHQENVGLLAARDGDAMGVVARKREVDALLKAREMAPRGPDERIALPVPTWAIENWLLDLLGHGGVDERRGPGAAGATWKQVFEREHPDEGGAVAKAAEEWGSGRLTSLIDGRAELDRLGQ